MRLCIVGEVNSGACQSSRAAKLAASRLSLAAGRDAATAFAAIGRSSRLWKGLLLERVDPVFLTAASSINTYVALRAAAFLRPACPRSALNEPEIAGPT
jgi:hypothetical protein